MLINSPVMPCWLTYTMIGLHILLYNRILLKIYSMFFKKKGFTVTHQSILSFSILKTTFSIYLLRSLLYLAQSEKVISNFLRRNHRPKLERKSFDSISNRMNRGRYDFSRDLLGVGFQRNTLYFFVNFLVGISDILF